MEEQAITPVREICDRIKQNVSKVIVGKDDVVELALVALLCEGHVLVEDVPGTGKTMLAKSLAKSIDCSFNRIQCTPDLLPSDVTGMYIFNQRTSDFEYRAGPIMSQIVLADEINRATPRTQSALLEAMQERQVTTEGETRPLPRPFLVMATQNPIELEGTFPLPEAQLDRFLMRLTVGYPSLDDDRRILQRYRDADPLDILQPVVTRDELIAVQKLCPKVYVSPDIVDYIISLTHATRDGKTMQLGASPRAMLALCHASQSLAAQRGRAFVIPDDVKYLTQYVFLHRLVPKNENRLRGNTAELDLQSIIESVAVPVED